MLKVNQETCIACGLCEQLCPQVFKLEDGGKSQVQANAPKDLPCIQEAIDSCPVAAISK